ELSPDLAILEAIKIEGVNIGRMLKAINDRIEILYNRDHQIGHTYFLPLKTDPALSRLADIFTTQIFPLLEEYFFEDRRVIRTVLGDDRKTNGEHVFLRPRFRSGELARLFGPEREADYSEIYEWNPEALDAPEAYISIYET
ncbi:MAG: hypothetical protein RIF32_00335, partial [Leptospirales bacterium]